MGGYRGGLPVAPMAQDARHANWLKLSNICDSDKAEMKYKLRRRRFGQLVIVSAAFAALGDLAKETFAQTSPKSRTPAAPTLEAGSVGVTLRVNGRSHAMQIEPRVTLLDALREQIGLTGTKKGCDHGQCGACTVLVNGRRINSCLSLAIANVGKSITTVEGLAKGDELHPMQAAFLAHDGFQCGYCTPGQIVSAVGLLGEECGPTDTEVRECMSGNLCRCGAYPNIVAAIQEVRKEGKNASV